jgi:D-alanine--poly(phosphoribitol) ligase subunit 1
METTVGSSIVARVQRSVSLYPELTAAVVDGRQVSYAELGQLIEQWRDRCLALDAPPHSIVGIVAGGQIDVPAAFLGVLAARLVPMLIDGRLPAARVAATFARACAAAVIDLARDEIRSSPEGARILPAEAGYVVFSSGSQGEPKGIVGLADGLVEFVDWEIDTLGAGPHTRVAMMTSPSFDVVLRDLLLPLCAGGELHIPSNLIRSSPQSVLPWLTEHGVSVLHAVPSLSARWVAAANAPADSLRWTLFAGEPLYGQYVARWRQAAPRSRVINLYGPSETTLAKFWHEVPAEVCTGLMPVGRPLPQARLELASADIDGAGINDHRIVINTPHGSLGYMPDTCSPADADRLHRIDGITRFETQDRGWLEPDGNLVVGGRLDSLVKRRGVFVDIAAIESAAADLPYVRAACCVQLAPSGRVVLMVEGPAPSATPQLLRDMQPRLRTELPDRVIAVSAMPLMNGGKTDRAGIRAMLEAEVSNA